MINLISGQSGSGMSLALCGPSDVNGTALRSGSVVPGPGVRIPPINIAVGPAPRVAASNLDLTGRAIVKRGALVSWHGFRGRVSRVRMGYLYPESGSPLAVNVGSWVACSAVQVVG